jgi:hypothetical protein
MEYRDLCRRSGFRLPLALWQMGEKTFGSRLKSGVIIAA